MKTMKKRLLAASLTTTMLLGALPLSTMAATEAVDRIVAECTVENFGQTLKRFELEVKDAALLEGVDAEDFIIENAVADHAGTIIDPKVTDVQVEGNKVTLEVEDFLLFKSGGSDKVGALEVNNTENAALSFAYTDIDEVQTAVADEFKESNQDGLVYKLFTPEKTSEPVPLVIWMHGRGDNGLQLISSPIATLFAAPENQEKNPSYVMAPQSDESVEAGRWTDAELDKIIKVVNGLIDEGKVDANRVYVIGHSMGGQGTWNLLRKAPDLFAAAVTMAPRIIEDEAELTDLENLKEIPVWLFHAESDPVNLVSGSNDRYNKLVELGSTNAKLTTYSDEEMMVYGLGEHSPFETHLSNVPVANDPEVVSWLYSQSKSGDSVTVTNEETISVGDEAEENTNKADENSTSYSKTMMMGVVMGLLLGLGYMFIKKKSK